MSPVNKSDIIKGSKQNGFKPTHFPKKLYEKSVVFSFLPQSSTFSGRLHSSQIDPKLTNLLIFCCRWQFVRSGFQLHGIIMSFIVDLWLGLMGLRSCCLWSMILAYFLAVLFIESLNCICLGKYRFVGLTSSLSQWLSVKTVNPHLKGKFSRPIFLLFCTLP